MKILKVDSSVNGADSVTRKLTRDIVEEISGGASANVTTRDLAQNPLPHIEGRPEMNDELSEFLDHDVIVIGAPTYNFTVPSQLKAWFDRLALAGVTFRYGEKGPEGLVGDKRVIVAIASGGHYEDGSAFEHNKSYVKAFFNFLGIEPEFVAARGVATDGDDAIERAEEEIDRLAA
ncbi:FMN-dependent NADH-azoreductase [Sphingomicrobium lutaoense]|uniref:FMN dependent NADH:quinone oxidoreductase n=1 Tax=Sphingomicrobium lutaoense TaxID=515949 RepID=A0A839Z0S4_9SPHN|nr:NAD(P)H-dependent oxidoreductase [Sphingomicrobium lutaoense]MBB3763165.1 FMN-dependent NADH-azoreductase [Sphingomicrobium lutaoense]